MYKGLIRPLLFLMNAEQAHHFTFKTLKVLFQIPGVKAITSLFFGSLKGREKQVMGLHFKNPVGLAAGFDKDAKLYNELSAFGFGFIEVGTLTPKPQDGNPKPRLFRIVEDEAVINRMGFNNGGLDAAALRLAKKKTDIIIGGNIGKNKVTPNDVATSDYIKGVEALHDVVDYFVVNVSSPNTPNLRELQEKEPLKALLKEVKAKNEALGAKPLMLKIAPDLTNGQLDDIVGIVNELKLSGVVATNTTISRAGLKASQEKVAAMGAGGLSGKILRERSTEVVRYLRNKLSADIAIVAVGGIFTGKDAKEKLDAGADLVQVWTGFLYEGPAMVRRMLRSL
ncbi:MAG: quinone-dependent dihydroorotate dehydrogenase [Bacteroidetes bacterium]|nr:MAG: quinone-dependent dihydroorotate dehydrogenase [Bacteroidota bacterium]REK54111.1 MAG: quinone-dependent dihydroorotate dehydrogenase [Bacteroidota bacterium]